MKDLACETHAVEAAVMVPNGSSVLSFLWPLIQSPTCNVLESQKGEESDTGCDQAMACCTAHAAHCCMQR